MVRGSSNDEDDWRMCWEAPVASISGDAESCFAKFVAEGAEGAAEEDEQERS